MEDGLWEDLGEANGVDGFLVNFWNVSLTDFNKNY